VSYQLILPFFPEELRALLRDPSISDLMINGTMGVYADKGGVLQEIRLSQPYELVEIALTGAALLASWPVLLADSV